MTLALTLVAPWPSRRAPAYWVQNLSTGDPAQREQCPSPTATVAGARGGGINMGEIQGERGETGEGASEETGASLSVCVVWGCAAVTAQLSDTVFDRKCGRLGSVRKVLAAASKLCMILAGMGRGSFFYSAACQVCDVGLVFVSAYRLSGHLVPDCRIPSSLSSWPGSRGAAVSVDLDL